MRCAQAAHAAVKLLLFGVAGFILSAQPSPYKPGDRVEVDVIMAGAPERGMWRAGTVKAVDAQTREIAIATDPATDAGGRTIEIPIHLAPKWIRRSTQAAPQAPAPQAPAPPPKSASAPAAPAAPSGILACPIDQPKVAPGSRPDAQLLAQVIRCLFEVRSQSPAEKSIKIDIHSLEIGSSRDCVPREDFGCGIPGHKIFPALVHWTKTDYYTHSIQWSDNESVFHCFVNPFGKWECGLGRRIRDGKLNSKQR